MTAAHRLRLEHIAHGHPCASDPTPADIRVLLVEIARLEAALDAAVKTAADQICERLLERRL